MTEVTILDGQGKITLYQRQRYHTIRLENPLVPLLPLNDGNRRGDAHPICIGADSLLTPDIATTCYLLHPCSCILSHSNIINPLPLRVPRASYAKLNCVVYSLSDNVTKSAFPEAGTVLRLHQLEKVPFQ